MTSSMRVKLGIPAPKAHRKLQSRNRHTEGRRLSTILRNVQQLYISMGTEVAITLKPGCGDQAFTFTTASYDPETCESAVRLSQSTVNSILIDASINILHVINDRTHKLHGSAVPEDEAEPSPDPATDGAPPTPCCLHLTCPEY